MRCLVTGGAGFIGSNLVEHLLTVKDGSKHDVVVYDNLLTGHRSNLQGFNCEFHQIDVSEELPDHGKFDWIFHQAAITDPRHGDDSETLHKNIVGFERILRLAEQHKSKLVYASTAGLYGNGPVPMKEDQPKEILTAYGESKWKMDQMATPLMGKMHIVGLRYFNVFGPRESGKGRPASMIYHLSKQMVEGKRPRIFKMGEQIRDHIYVKDCVRANLLALEGKCGVYNVGTGIGTNFNELVAALNRCWKMDLAPEYFDMPYDPKTYQSNTQAEPSLAAANLKFKAKYSLDDGILDYIPSMKKEFNLS